MLISVIIPTYNRATTICRAIDSVLRQTYTEREIIVVDDGSVDNTMKVLERYRGQVIVISQPNAGPSAARNHGVSRANGQAIAFLDSDDIWQPNKLELQAQLLEKGGAGVPCCVCDTAFRFSNAKCDTSFQLAGMAIGNHCGYLMNPYDIIATRFFIFNQAVLIWRDVFKRVGGFNENLRIMEDSDLALRLSLLGPWGIVGIPLVEKYDDTEGIGVTAMKDRLRHMSTWQTIIDSFVSEHLVLDVPSRHWFLQAAQDAKDEVFALDLGQRGNLVGALLGRVLVTAGRVRRGVRRRLPNWPKPQILPSVTSSAEGSC